MSVVTEARQLPILFTGEMVRAILRDENPKTQTRRVIRADMLEVTLEGFDTVDDVIYAGEDRFGLAVYDYLRCPYGRPGHLLYVREAFQIGYSTGEWDQYTLVPPTSADTAEATRRVFFRADYPDGSGPPKWKPSIHMPKALARLWLRVTEVRVERVQEISEADAKAEGVEPVLRHRGWNRDGASAGGALSHADAFEDLWDSINADRGYSWESNPWVWVVSFERTEAP